MDTWDRADHGKPQETEKTGVDVIGNGKPLTVSQRK